jgi:hypothetical protein
VHCELLRGHGFFSSLAPILLLYLIGVQLDVKLRARATSLPRRLMLPSIRELSHRGRKYRVARHRKFEGQRLRWVKNGVSVLKSVRQERRGANAQQVGTAYCADAHGGLQRRSDRPLVGRVTLDFSVEVAEETNPFGTMIAKLSPGFMGCKSGNAR